MMSHVLKLHCVYIYIINHYISTYISNTIDDVKRLQSDHKHHMKVVISTAFGSHVRHHVKIT